MDIMMLLEGQALNDVYSDFMKKEEEEDDGLDLHEFIDCMLRRIPKVTQMTHNLHQN